MIQRMLHWKPGRANQLLSAGATYEEKRVDRTYTPVEIRVPDWDMGPKLHASLPVKGVHCCANEMLSQGKPF